MVDSIIHNTGPVGQSTPRIDAREKVTGAAVYTDDLQFGNALLHARIKRSPHPHALIKKIDVTQGKGSSRCESCRHRGGFSRLYWVCTCRTASSSAGTVCAMWATRSRAWPPSARRSPKRPWT